MRTAIIGAGIAGLACANRLVAAGHDVVLFDKARGTGGRLSTRRVATARGEIAFDHGATHFTVRSPEFRALAREWMQGGHAAPWPVAGLDAWVGVPTMNAPVKAMAAHHKILWSSHISAIVREDGAWSLYRASERIGPFDAVVVAIPAEQAAPLPSLLDFGLARAAMAVRSYPIWTAMFAFDRGLKGLPDFFKSRGPILYGVRGNARPGRARHEHWIVQADWTWSEAHIGADAATICRELLSALGQAGDIAVPEPFFADAHRWLFAQPSGSDAGHLWNAATGLGVCGDWLAHGYVEHAWRSGHELGATMTRGARSSSALPQDLARADGDADGPLPSIQSGSLR